MGECFVYYLIKKKLETMSQKAEQTLVLNTFYDFYELVCIKIIKTIKL